MLLGVVMIVQSLQAETVSQERTSAPVTAEEAIARAEEMYGTLRQEQEAKACAPAEDDIIVVCGAQEDPDQFRVPSRLEQGDESHLDWDGKPPDFSLPPCVPNLLTICPKIGAPPPPPLLVDVTALPEPPPGSDADKIAKGETPE